MSAVGPSTGSRLPPFGTGTAAGRPSARFVLAGMALACMLGLAAALVAQHRFDMPPCPWCILQRMIYVVIAVVCGGAALLGNPAGRRGLAGLAGLLAVAGVASAVYQHAVAAKTQSCNLTFADKLISASGLETALPAIFGVTASCADAAVSVAGLPFAYWSGLLFGLLALAAAWVVRRPA